MCLQFGYVKTVLLCEDLVFLIITYASQRQALAPAPGPGAVPGTAIRTPTWALISGTFIPAWLLITRVLAPWSWGPGLPNSKLRVFKQVGLPLYPQVPEHLAGHLLPKKAFLNQNPEAGLGCIGSGEATPDFALRALGQVGVGMGMWGKQP